MLLSDAAPPERRSAQVIYPAAFHPQREETPQQWAAEAMRQHRELLAATCRDVIERADAYPYLAGATGVATPIVRPGFRQDAVTGQLSAVGFGAGLAFQGSSIVAPLPQPPRGWLARFLGGRR